MSRTVVSGNVVVDQWTVRDFTGAPVTGQAVPTHVTLTLRRQSGAAMVAAGESVSWTEIGATGTYYTSFTPLNSGLYKLDVREIGPATALRADTFDYDVFAPGALYSPTYTNAFCAESDIERWLQHPISSSSKPNDTEAAAFAEARAAQLMTLCASLGFTVTPSTVVAGSRLEDLLREANAIGAALDWSVASFFSESPNASDRAETLQTLWDQYFGEHFTGAARAALGTIALEVRSNLASLSTNHILSGDTVARTEGSAPTDEGIQIGMGSVF